MDREVLSFTQAVSVLPQRLRQAVMALPIVLQAQVEEVRLRVGLPLSVVLPEGEQFLQGGNIVATELDQLLEIASRTSVHSVIEQVRRGYLTLIGGHRLGLCGTAVMREGEIHILRRLSSANLRIARQFIGSAVTILPQITTDIGIANTLILAPAGMGKTTLLRDIIRTISMGEGIAPLRVGLADERGEVAALRDGIPQLDVGCRTDVVEGCPKDKALLLLLRAMNPQVLAVDEITAPEDVVALVQAVGCGASVLATAHGTSRKDLERRPLYQTLLDAKVFEQLVTIQRCNGSRKYSVEALI